MVSSVRWPTSDGISLRAHEGVFSYIADILECMDIFAVVHGNQSSWNCYRYIMKPSEMAKRSIASYRNVYHTQEVLPIRSELQLKAPNLEQKYVGEVS